MILVTPIAPARTGNGLAMRAGVLLEALAARGPVDLVVVPVAGPAAPCDWARALARRVQVVDPLDGTDGDGSRVHLDRQLGDAWLRAKLEVTAPLPATTRRVPASLADDVAVTGTAVDAVVGLRVHLAPLTVTLARRLGAAPVVDADDDDVALLRALGSADEADAVERLARAWLPECAAVWAAAGPDATAMAARYGVPVTTVPNAVRLPGPVAPPPAGADLLFVGNLTYAPNLDAARLLATEVLPRVRAVRPDATLTLVGPTAPGALDGIAAVPGVVCTGRVDDVAPYYARAAVVVAPLRYGAGTRIKVLEAAAFGRPVVATATAVAGLDLGPDGVMVADTPDALAAAVVALLADPARGAAVAATARTAVRRYAVDRVGGTVRRALIGAAPDAVLTRRVLWHPVEIEGPPEVRDALDAVLPSAAHDFPAGEPFRYAVEPATTGGYHVLEGADPVARVADAVAARDVAHARFHRRVFERASRAGWLRVHGALVDLDGVRVLCTGPEGAGKSTLALRMLLDGLALQGDESVVLRGRDVIAVARPLHCKPGAEAVVPELAHLPTPLPVVDGIRIVDPGRLGHDWRIAPGTLDHVVVLGGVPAGDGAARLQPASQTEVLPDLVDALFPVTESKPALLRALTTGLAGVACHRLARGDPAAMVRAVRALG